MILLQFNIRNPWSNQFKNIWNRSWSTPFKNKVIELEVIKDVTLISFQFNWTIRQSHAGLELEAGLFGYCIQFNFYDSRHWDYINNCYETYSEDKIE
jgi:hypothetical protein